MSTCRGEQPTLPSVFKRQEAGVSPRLGGARLASVQALLVGNWDYGPNLRGSYGLPCYEALGKGMPVSEIKTCGYIPRGWRGH